jgi:hypothetical protein
MKFRCIETPTNSPQFGGKFDMKHLTHITYKCANCDKDTSITQPVYSFFSREVEDWAHSCCCLKCRNEYATKAGITEEDPDTTYRQKLHQLDEQLNRGFYKIRDSLF